MTASIAIAIVSEVLANLPAIVTTGGQVISLINSAYGQITEAIGDRDATPEEIRELVAKITANSATIQSL